MPFDDFLQYVTTSSEGSMRIAASRDDSVRMPLITPILRFELGLVNQART